MTTITTPLTPTASSRPTESSSPLATTMIFVGRSMRHTLRNVDALIMAIALPVLLMSLFTYVFGGAISGGTGDYVTYVVPGIILLCAGFGASSTAVDVANDMTNGVIERLRTMPVRASAVVTGHVIASLVRNLIATAVVFGVALLMGFRPTASLAEWVGAVALIALFILAITWLYAAIGMASGSVEAANGYGFALLFLPYVSSAFVPTDTMPGWMQWFADNQPITPIIETLRALLTSGPLGSSPWLAIGWCALIVAGAYAWARFAFGRKSGQR